MKEFSYDISRCVVFDVEVCKGRWLVGFRGPRREGREGHLAVDGDADRLRKVLRRVERRGLTLVGWNSSHYDLPVLRAILAGVDPYAVSMAIVEHTGPGLPDEVLDRLRGWPRPRVDHIDLAMQTKDLGEIKALKVVGANIGFPRLRELPFDMAGELDEGQWGRIKEYNAIDLDLTWAVLEHFDPDMRVLAALSTRFETDLRSVHPAGIAAKILCNAYRRAHGTDPARAAAPAALRYIPPAAVRRPRDPVAAGWYDALTTRDFPMVNGPRGGTAKPAVPEPPAPIAIGGLTLNVGQGGLHSVDPPAIHRSDGEFAIVEADVSSFYPTAMVTFGISPRSLGDVGRDLYGEILGTRLALKAEAQAATDPAEARRKKVQADGLKIVLNSTFGQLGNPHSPLYDPEALLRVTISGQLLLLDLVEGLDGCAAVAGLIGVNTDSVVFRARRDDDAWRGVLDAWQARTGMTLEVCPLDRLAVLSTNHYAAVTAAGKVKRRGALGDPWDWKHVPNFPIVADAVTAALLDGTPPEVTVRACADPKMFTAIVRRPRRMAGVLIDDATKAEGPVGRLLRFYRATGSGLRVEHRWSTEDGKAHATTPTNARGIRPLMDLPDHLPADLDVAWYVGEARRLILDHAGFPHLDPRWLDGDPTAQDLHSRGLAPAPKMGKCLPAGARADRPSYFWSWRDFASYGTYTGPLVAVLVLDLDVPEKFRAWVDSLGDPLFDDLWATLAGACVSYHRDGTPEAVRTGRGRGKLLFRFAAGPDHPLARIAISRWLKTRGLEIFFGKGVPTVLGMHPDGPDSEYVLDGDLGEPPAWLVEGLTPKVKPLKRRPARDGSVDGAALLAAAAERVAAVPEGNGERNDALFTTALRIGAHVAAGTIDHAEAQRTLVAASTLAPDEAQGAVQRAFAYRGAAGGNGDGKGGGGPHATAPRRPEIVVDTELGRIRDEILALLPADPDLYRRGNTLVRLVRIGAPAHTLRGGVRLRETDGLCTIVPVDDATFLCRMTTLASFVRWERTKQGEEVARPCAPPAVPAHAVLNHVAYPGVRAIEGVVEAPYLRPDGTLSPPGYDAETGMVYIPGVAFDPPPDAPTRGDAEAAARHLLAPLAQFPFDSDNDRAVWLAAALGMVARPMIPGPVPGIALVGNRAGIGKGKLVTAAGLIAAGRPVPTTMYPTSKEETIKTKVALALAGATAVFFDNLEDGSTYGNGPLDSAITDLVLNERMLGMSRTTGEIMLRPCWFLAGNNLSPAKDAFRRWLVCNLRSRLEDPEERDDLTIKDLPAYILAHRGPLLRDVLIILKAHALAGRPTDGWAPLGSFEEWDPVVRGAVWFATGWDCSQSRKAAAREAPERLKKLALLDAWESIPDGGGTGNGIRVRDAHARATALDEDKKPLHPELNDAFLGFAKDGKFPSPETIGRVVGGMADVLIDGKMFTKVGKERNAIIWKVVRPG